jgi:hypothetical protein
MFVRAKKSGKYEYLQVVHNVREGRRVRQHVIATLGRVDVLRATGQLDALLSSCSRFADRVAVLDAHRRGRVEPAHTLRIGPPLVFEKLWRETGLAAILEDLLAERKFEFAVERAVWLTVLHRLFDPGSDRAAELWRHGYALEGTEGLELHHLYRAMAWLGEELPAAGQAQRTAFAPRTTKDLVEERLFARRRDLFSTLDLVFFDTTSVYFEGEGGATLGTYGYSRDHRPDLRQMAVGAALDGTGRPVCCELWPGNTHDATVLAPVLRRLRGRFGVGSVCVVADRGMVSQKAIAALGADGLDVRFILGMRLRQCKEVQRDVLSRGGRYREVVGPRQRSKDPGPLKVKEVWVGPHRYIVCYNEAQARKDRRDRETLVAALRDKLSGGDKRLVPNKGYRRYLKGGGRGRFAIDMAKVRAEARYDGKWVLRTDLALDAAEVALRYKELWRVEQVFRSIKSVLATRPIYHRCDETIRGHVFCSFLALVLLDELLRRLAARGWRLEWERLKRDLDALEHITIGTGGKSFVVRSETRGDAGKALQAAGVALGPVVRVLSGEDSEA